MRIVCAVIVMAVAISIMIGSAAEHQLQRELADQWASDFPAFSPIPNNFDFFSRNNLDPLPIPSYYPPHR